MRSEPNEYDIGTACSYSTRLYGAASGVFGCEYAYSVDITRLEQLLAATYAYCRDPSLGIESVAQPLDALRSHPAP